MAHAEAEASFKKARKEQSERENEIGQEKDALTDARQSKDFSAKVMATRAVGRRLLWCLASLFGAVRIVRRLSCLPRRPWMRAGASSRGCQREGLATL